MPDEGDPVALDEVFYAFLEAERNRARYDALKSIFVADGGAVWDIIHNVAGAERLGILRRAIEEPSALSSAELPKAVRMLGEYGDHRIPLVPFTVGSNGDDRRHEVRAWVLRKNVPLTEFWIPRLNDETHEALTKSRFNLARAALLFPAVDRWTCLRFPADQLQPVIAIEDGDRNPSPIHDGNLQLLDGAHRIVALAISRKTSVHSFIGLRH